MTGDMMKGHPYLRAYMAGVLLPSWVLLIALGGFLLGHLTQRLPAGLDRALIFPMAVVPNVWGLWNLLYVSLGLKKRTSIGVFGAVLPLILAPAGVALASTLGLRFYTIGHVLVALPVIIAIYYLAWKYGVGFFNRILELS
jgi:hypothetical protein